MPSDSLVQINSRVLLPECSGEFMIALDRVLFLRALQISSQLFPCVPVNPEFLFLPKYLGVFIIQFKIFSLSCEFTRECKSSRLPSDKPVKSD